MISVEATECLLAAAAISTIRYASLCKQPERVRVQAALPVWFSWDVWVCCVAGPDVMSIMLELKAAAPDLADCIWYDKDNSK